MKYTHHCLKQIHNRGITHTMVELIELFGYQVGDRIILDKKTIQQLLAEITELRNQLIKMYEKGGMVIVEREGNMITAFPITRRLGKVTKAYKKAS